MQVVAEAISDERHLDDQHVKAYQVEFYADSFNATNIQPIKSILDDHWRERVNDDADFGVSQSRIGVSLKHNNWLIALESRNDHFLVTNPTSASLYQYSKTQFPDEQTDYHLDIQYKKLQAKGIKLGYQWSVSNNLSITNVFGLWRPSEVRVSELTGQIQFDERITGQAQLEEWYSHKNLLKRPEDKAWNQGHGYSWDIDLMWRPISQLTIQALVKDAYNHVKFDDVGYSAGALNSETTFRDENNILRFNPAYSGVETTKSLSWKLPKTILVNLEYNNEQTLYFVQHEKRSLNLVTLVGVGRKLNNGVIKAGFDLQNSAMYFAYKNDWFSTAIQSDDLRLNNAEVFRLSMNINFAFGG
ncbi:hypothetical protein GCM10027050_24910 [Psychrosphaera aestuarii]